MYLLMKAKSVSMSMCKGIIRDGATAVEVEVGGAVVVLVVVMEGVTDVQGCCD